MGTTPRNKRDVVVVGASLGGVKAFRRLFAGLPADFPGVVAAVLHRGSFGGPGLGAVLRTHSALPIVEPESSLALASGTVYVAPRDQHLVFRDHRLEPDRGAKEHFTRPAIDPLFRSAAERYGERVVGILLTGTGHDGVSGLIAIKARGGFCLVQDPDEAEAPALPMNAVLHDHVDLVLPLDDLAPALVQLAAGKPLDWPFDTVARRERIP